MTTLELPPSTAPAPDAPAADPGTRTGATTGAPGPATTDSRGDVVQETGQTASLQGPDGGQVVAFSVDAITVDPACDGPSRSPSERGHLVALSVRLTTGELTSGAVDFSMGPQDFAITPTGGDPDFGVATPAAAACLADGGGLGDQSLASNSQYVGTIVLDSPVASGQVLFSPPALRGAGWTWSF